MKSLAKKPSVERILGEKRSICHLELKANNEIGNINVEVLGKNINLVKNCKLDKNMEISGKIENDGFGKMVLIAEEVLI